jgi:glutaconate CoA-transferase subunit B
MTPGPSLRELMVCQIAERLADHDIVIIGGASLIPMAASLLAQRTHAPNLTLLTGSGAVNPRPKFLAESSGDHIYVKSAEAYYTMEDVFDHTERGRFGVSVFGGIQIDAYGNFNLTHVGGTLSAPVMRGPGFVNAGLAMTIGRYMFVSERHTPAVFVDCVDFASGAGSRRPDGTPYPPGRLGHGPQFCITPLASFDFGAAEDRMRVVSLHPGVEMQTVRDQTGFELSAVDQLPTTPPPEAALLEILRRSIDTTAVLRARS